jgi:hypothetical protein
MKSLMMAEERLKHVGLKIHFDIIFLFGRGVGGNFSSMHT